MQEKRETNGIREGSFIYYLQSHRDYISELNGNNTYVLPNNADYAVFNCVSLPFTTKLHH